MSPPLVIDTDAVRVLANRLDIAALEADRLRSLVLGLLVSAEIDDAAPAHELASIDEELGLVATVLRARAAQADYPLHDSVAVALAEAVATATTDLQLVLGPVGPRVEAGRGAARALRHQGSRPREELLRSILQNAADPSFARGFAEELTPEQAAALVLDASTIGPHGPYASAVTPDDRDAWARRHQLLLDALGHAFAEAARWNGPFALAAGGAERWIAAITADPQDPRRGARYGQGAALALIAAHGDFDPAWLGAVADGVYRYERATAVGSTPLWAPRANLGATWLGPVEPDGSNDYDPLATLLGALGTSAEAAQAFFTAGGAVKHASGGIPIAVSERLAYLLGARRWPVDDGAGLGAALVAATTERRDRSDSGRVSAQRASQVVAIVGGRTGKRWTAPEGIRPALAAIVAGYMPDVFQTVQSGSDVLSSEGYWADTAGFPPDGPFGATFRLQDLVDVVEAIGTDIGRTRQLVAAVLGTERLRLAHAVETLVGQDPELARKFLASSGGGGEAVSFSLLENAVSAAGSTLGFLVQHGYRALDKEEKRIAAARKQLSELLQVALGLPFIPSPAGPWRKFAVKQATSYVFDAWKSSVPHDAKALYGSLDLAVAAELRDLVLDDLLARGMLHPSAPVVGFQPPPADALERHADGTPYDPARFDRTSKAYLDWVTTYAPNSWLATQVTLFYDAAFGHIG